MRSSVTFIVPPSAYTRSIAKRITNETYNWVSDPRWHPSGDKVIATKWYFSSRSLGAGEGWEFPVPVSAESPVEAGAGRRLVSKRLPMGWTKADYVEQQIGHEQFVWAGDDALIYAGNVKDVGGTYTYSKGVLASTKCIHSCFMRFQMFTRVSTPYSNVTYRRAWKRHLLMRSLVVQAGLHSLVMDAHLRSYVV